MGGGKSFSSVRDAQVDSSDLHDDDDDEDYDDGSSDEEDDFDETSDDEDDDGSYQEDDDIENEVGNRRDVGKHIGIDLYPWIMTPWELLIY